ADRERVGRQGQRGGDSHRCRAEQPPPQLPFPSLLDEGLELVVRRPPWRSDHCGASMSSAMLRVKIDRQEPTELFEQVAAEIRRAIADGEAKPGERLPPARDLAAVLGVNTNTVLRSLRLLREEGMLEFRRGRGVTVAGTPERGAVIARARDLISFARQQGYRRDELIQLIEEIAS